MRESDIDAHLKRAFQELADEALPDRFNDLLAQLRSGGASGRERTNGVPQDEAGGNPLRHEDAALDGAGQSFGVDAAEARHRK